MCEPTFQRTVDGLVVDHNNRDAAGVVPIFSVQLTSPLSTVVGLELVDYQHAAIINNV